MAEKQGKADAEATEPTREDRLKSALKANMAKRKAQAKARAAAVPKKEQD